MANIGIVGYWGFGRGNAYVNLMFANMLKDDHKVTIFNPVVNDGGKAPYSEKDFKDDKINVLDYENGWNISPEVFRLWITEMKLDAVIFNEYDQWKPSEHDLIKIAREENCKIYGFLVNERFKKEQAGRYDRVFCPNMTQVRLMRRNRIRNFTYVPYSVDVENIEHKKEKNEKFTFFHPGGMIGVNERKNTSKVIEAFRLLDRDDTKLIITSQVRLGYGDLPKNVEVIDKNLSHEEIMDYYKQADVTLYPPKWETIGIGILESLATGTPVLTTDFPPMNEYVVANKNGLLCPVMINRYEDILVHVAEIDPSDLKNKMETIMNEFIQNIMKNNARYIVEELYDIKKNKKYLLDFLKDDLGEKK